MILGFIILGLLSYESMTGYDLKTFFDRSINFFWSAELSQIYRELSKLETKGYVNFTIEHQEGKPDKKIYSLTEEGEKAFIEWLRSFPQSLSPASRNELLVRIFFSSRLTNEELILQLDRFLKKEEDELRSYRQIEEKIEKVMKENKDCSKEFFYQKLTVRRGLYFAQGEINWAKECLSEIKKLHMQE